MTPRFSLTALMLAFFCAGAAHGQTVPEGQSCGGLLCDMGVFGHKTPPPPGPAPSPPVASASVAPAPAPAAAAAVQPIAKPERRVVHRRKASPRASVKSVAAAAPVPPATAHSAAPAIAAPPPTTRPAGGMPLIFQTVDPRM